MFLYYMYKDELDSRLYAELAAAVLHIAQYYGAPRLAGLCERRLAREIKDGDAEDEGATGSTGSALLCMRCSRELCGLSPPTKMIRDCGTRDARRSYMGWWRSCM